MTATPYHFAQPPHLAMVGLIGAGKTTLARGIATAMQLPFHAEGHSPYLPKFYADMEKYAATIQFERFVFRYTQASNIKNLGHGGVQDRSHWEDLIFAECLHKTGKMKTEDFETYTSLMSVMPLPVPTALIFLRVSPEVALERIRQRGIECEQGIDLVYLQELHAAYEAFIEEVSKKVHVVVLEWNEIAPIDTVVQLVTKAISEARLISYIDANKK